MENELYILIAAIVWPILLRLGIWFWKSRQPDSSSGKKIDKDELKELLPMIIQAIKQVLDLGENPHGPVTDERISEIVLEVLELK